MRLLPLAAALGALALVPLAADAQGRDKREPDRPKLDAGADTNDPRAYYAFGEGKLRNEPRRAADAFYWAMRLDPTWADALYARRTALLLGDRRRLVRYLNRDRRTLRHEEIQRIDSLHMRALMANPFFYRKYERTMMEAYVVAAVVGNDSPHRYSQSEIEFIWSSYLMRAPAATQGWAAYADGRFDAALDRYGRAIPGEKRKAYLRTERGRIFQMTGRPDSALAMLRLAVDELRQEDDDETVFLYDSKALLEFSIGKIHETRDDPAGAREAYGRALQEDLAFYPAHVALASLALTAGDTATVVSELELATELRPDDPAIRLLYGYSLAQLGRRDAAIAQLERAIAIEPLFARPYYLLSELLEAAGQPERAAERLEQFIAHAAKTAPDYQRAVTRLAALRPARGGR